MEGRSYLPLKDACLIGVDLIQKLINNVINTEKYLVKKEHQYSHISTLLPTWSSFRKMVFLISSSSGAASMTKSAFRKGSEGMYACMGVTITHSLLGII